MTSICDKSSSKRSYTRCGWTTQRLWVFHQVELYIAAIHGDQSSYSENIFKKPRPSAIFVVAKTNIENRLEKTTVRLISRGRCHRVSENEKRRKNNNNARSVCLCNGLLPRTFNDLDQAPPLYSSARAGPREGDKTAHPALVVNEL